MIQLINMFFFSFLLGYYRSLYLLINSKLPSSIEYSDLSRVPIAKILLENVLKPLHFTYNSCPEGARWEWNQFIDFVISEDLYLTITLAQDAVWNIDLKVNFALLVWLSLKKNVLFYLACTQHKFIILVTWLFSCFLVAIRR